MSIDYLQKNVIGTENPKLPLKFYEDMTAFKLFLLDCGLLACMSEVPADQMLISDNVFKEFRDQEWMENIPLYITSLLTSSMDSHISSISLSSYH